MSDWDYLHDMRAEGYSEEVISDAAATGMAPWNCLHIDENELRQDIDSLKNSLNEHEITRKEFALQMKVCRKRKKELKNRL
ncbi:TPA: hypothetical protein ACNUTA_003471 [Vibrio cholerae]|nr:hypothetical protein [Vibrio cholerae]HAS3409942.1 hypothetical protein [Vibrio cholerae]